ncbi:MAG: hypothetical protein ACTSXQ_08150 [Alphaproteobacteria bacterium]
MDTVPMDDYVYIFHHIPKCGGMSCRAAFRLCFNVIDDYYELIADKASPKEFQENKQDLAQLNNKDLLCGHFHGVNCLKERYPRIFKDKKYRLITFLRDPLEKTKSLYRYKGAKSTDTREDFLNYLFTPPSKKAENIQKYIPCNEGNYRIELDQYWFVGLTEDLQTSFDVLSTLLNKPKIKVPLLNTTYESDHGLSKNDIRRFEQLNSLEYAIYRYAQEKFEGIKREVLGSD